MRRYQHVLSLLPGDQVDGLFQDGLLKSDSGDTILECWADMADLMSETDELGGLQFLEVRSTLPDELLMYADKLSMAHGLELRVPFLDKEIVEYVERLPGRLQGEEWFPEMAAPPGVPDLSSRFDSEAAEARICRAMSWMTGSAAPSTAG